MYMDYEIYHIEVDNRSNNKIKIADLNRTNSFYLTDDKNINYYAYLNELSDETITIPSKFKCDINIKYIIKQNLDRKIKSMCLNNVILNLENRNYEQFIINL